MILVEGSPNVILHVAGDACWPEPDPALAEAMAVRSLHDDGTASFGDGSEQETDYRFDRLNALPAACLEPPATPRASVVALADLMSAHYPGFSARGVDFAGRRRAVLDALPADASEVQAFVAAEALLAGLDDAHVELEAEIDGETLGLTASQGRTLDRVLARRGDRPERAWLRAWREGIEQRVLAGRGHVAGASRLFWGVNDGVGYLAVVTMGGFGGDDGEGLEELDAALDEAMAQFEGASAVIVDVSNNRGGYDSVSLHIAGRFADRPRLAYSKRAWGSGSPAQPIEVRPHAGPRYLGPVVILTSDVTVSAGETFVLAMRALPNVTHVGATTRGALSDQTPVTLPNGWTFAMPMELYVGPDGRNLEGVGITPQRRWDLFPANDLDQGHASAVLNLMARLRTGRPL